MNLVHLRKTQQAVNGPIYIVSTGSAMNLLSKIAAVLSTLLLSQVVSGTTPLGDWTAGTASFFGGPQVRCGRMCRASPLCKLQWLLLQQGLPFLLQSYSNAERLTKRVTGKLHDSELSLDVQTLKPQLTSLQGDAANSYKLTLDSGSCGENYVTQRHRHVLLSPES